MVGFHDPGGYDLMTRYAAELGRDFACIRVYMKPSDWGTVTPEFSHDDHFTWKPVPISLGPAGEAAGGGEGSRLGDQRGGSS
jgi:hypothetical protein